MASASHVHQTASASAILARIAVPPPPVPLTTRIPAAPPPPLHQCLCCPPPPPPPPIPIHSVHFAHVRNAMGSGLVELRGLSVRAHWYDDHAWICVDVQEAVVVASGSIYELLNAHISLASVSGVLWVLAVSLAAAATAAAVVATARRSPQAWFQSP